MELFELLLKVGVEGEEEAGEYGTLGFEIVGGLRFCLVVLADGIGSYLAVVDNLGSCLVVVVDSF
jgi:hypothetical protein